jgi:glycosyltransferase involved in cell wall biosynthesis
MKKTKLLFTIPNFDTAGSGILLYKTILQLDRDRFEPHICCMHDQGNFFKTIEALNIPIHIYDYTTPMVPRLKGLANAWKISRFFKKHDFDLIFSFHYSSDYSEGLAAKLAGIPWMYIKKNMSWHGPSHNSWKLRTFFASGIVAQNKDMVKQFFPGLKKVTMIPSGVDTEEFHPQEKAAYLYDELNIPKDARILLTVANLVPVKGIETLIDAFAAYAASHTEKPLRLLIVGDNTNEYGQFLVEKVNEMDLSEQVLFTGKRPDVPAFQSIADIFVIPTLNEGRQEGSPVALLEAMASGTYVLATDVAGIRDQLVDLPGQLFEAKDTAALTQKIEQALALDAEGYQAVIDKQLEIIRSTYTMEHIGRQYEAVYLKVLGHGV